VDWQELIKWLLAPGGLLALIIGWMFRNRIATKVSTSWLGRRISIEKENLSLKGQILIKDQELNSNRESFLRQLADKDAELAMKERLLGYQTLSMETLIRQGQRLATQVESSTLTTSEGSPKTPSDSPVSSQT
jgi:hypothetical protein